MNFKIKMDCKPGDPAVFLEHQSAILAATMMYNTYQASRETLIGVGPELYGEQWIYNFVAHSKRSFEDLIMIYFVKILQGAQNV